MAPKKEKEAIIILLDVGHNSKQCYKTGETFFDSSKRCISMIVERKLFSCSADELALIEFGCKETSNSLSSTSDGEYNNIKVVSHLSRASWDLLRYLENAKSSDCTADWLDAIIVAMQFIRDETEAKDFVQKKIVVFSNFDSKVSDISSVGTIISGFNSMSITFVVIGPNAFDLRHIKGKNKSECQIKGESLVLDIVNETDSVMCNFEDAIAELMYIQRKSVRPSPWNAVLTISANIKIAIAGYKKVSDPLPIKWLSEIIDDQTAPIEKSQAYFKITPDGNQVEVDKTKCIDSYRFGADIVPYSDVEKKTMSYQSGNKGLYLIGFTDQENIPPHMLTGYGSYIITNRHGDEVGKVALQAFINVLNEENKAGIAKKVYSDNRGMALGALFPMMDSEATCLVFVELPFAEDERLYSFGSLDEYKPTEEQSKAVNDLIDSMDLDENVDASTDEKYDPRKTYDPRNQHVFHCISYKALHPDEPLPDNMADIVKPMLQPSPDIVEKSKPALKKIKELFPLKDNTEFLKRKKFDRRKLEEKEEIKQENRYGNKCLSDMVQQKVDKIGTVRPDQDFLLLLKSGKPHEELCKEMQNVIIQLLTSFSYEVSKPKLALTSLRESCLMQNTKLYNNWLPELKALVTEKEYFSFWDAVANDKLGLISKEESQNSDISIEEAKDFLNLGISIADIASNAGYDQDTLDDLFDEM